MEQISQFCTANGPLIVAICTAITAVSGLIRSEMLALNPNTPINGILQGRLAKAGLAVLPVVVDDMVKGVDTATIINDVADKIAKGEAAPEKAEEVSNPAPVETPAAPVASVPAAAPDLITTIAAKQAELDALTARAAQPQGVDNAA